MSNEIVNYQARGDVAVITMDKPPVNGLGYALRRDVADAIDRAAADPAVRAIVLTGAARFFSGGADITEFNTPNAMREPRLATLISLLEECAKPVVAAISGNCLGGGLELAMGTHYRVAAPDAQLGLPEVKLGLLPGGGGTQRLPRLIGLESALNMIVSGASARADALAGTALIDEIIDGELIDGAVRFAKKVLAEQRPLRRTRDLNVEDSLACAYLAFARNSVAAGKDKALLPAQLKCVEAIAASVQKPFTDALQIERAGFQWLMQSPESRALRHIFQAERTASKIPDVPDGTPLRDIRQVGVIGAGTMGGGIAMSFLNAGIPVVLLEIKQELLDKGLATIRKNYENSVAKGKLSASRLDERMALLTPTLAYESFGGCDLVVEAVFESMDAKEQVFRKLDDVCKPGAILASNTSALDLNRIADVTQRPRDVIGLHFFSPANVMRLLEIVRGKATAGDVLATCMAMARKIKKIAVVSGVCDGFIGNRMVARYVTAANQLLEQGASPQQVDKALQEFGLSMGPCRMNDLAGIDIGYAGRMRRKAANPDAYTPFIADLLAEAGRYGQKTGAGWYRYEAGKRDPIPDPAVDQIIAAYRAERGIVARKISNQEIVERCVFALVNEAARILEDGIAARASDIDIVYLNGYGFPRHRGGPMLYADIVGLPNVVRSLRRFAAEPGAASWWKPAPLLVRLADAGQTFN